MKLASVRQAEPKWFIIDCQGKVLGRVATEAANLLRGKSKVEFVPYLNCGDHVVIINAKDIEMTGNKLEKKVYYSHSWYPGGLKAKQAKTLMEENPSEILTKAVKGMLPNNKLRNEWMKMLHVYNDAEHPHKANLAAK